MVAIEEIFSYQFSFADIEADKYIEYRRSHADPRIHAMDRLTDDGVDELVKLCLPFSHKKNGLAVQAGRPYMRLEMMVRLHLLQISLNYSDGVPDEQRSRAALLSSAFWANHRF